MKEEGGREKNIQKKKEKRKRKIQAGRLGKAKRMETIVERRGQRKVEEMRLGKSRGRWKG